MKTAEECYNEVLSEYSQIQEHQAEINRLIEEARDKEDYSEYSDVIESYYENYF